MALVPPPSQGGGRSRFTVLASLRAPRSIVWPRLRSFLAFVAAVLVLILNVCFLAIVCENNITRYYSPSVVPVLLAQS